MALAHVGRKLVDIKCAAERQNDYSTDFSSALTESTRISLIAGWQQAERIFFYVHFLKTYKSIGG